jgi:UDP-N-acetylmuramate dehydrogenase
VNGEQQQRLAALVSQEVKWQCRLDRYTSFAIGGPAEALVRVDLRQELQPLLGYLAGEKIAWRVIGRGTNLLVRDEGFAGVVILLGREFDRYAADVADGKVIVNAGGSCGLAGLSLWCAENGLTGLEFACGIPGTVGGGVIMNAGTRGQEISAIIESVTVVTPDKTERRVRRDLDFSYRRWDGYARYHGQAVVAEVELALQRGDAAAIKARCKMLQEKRKASQPREHANAGSFFRNPPHDSAGRLIEVCGLKGMIVGGAMISERHGNFLVNRGGATAGDVLQLMKAIQEKVYKDYGVMLEPEVHFI